MRSNTCRTQLHQPTAHFLPLGRKTPLDSFPSSASRTSSTNWPVLISTTNTICAFAVPLPQRLRGERPQSDRAEKPGAQRLLSLRHPPRFAAPVKRFRNRPAELQDPRPYTAHGAFQALRLYYISRPASSLVSFQVVRLQKDGRDEILSCVGRPSHRPGLFR